MSLQAGYYSRRVNGVNDPGKLDKLVALYGAVANRTTSGANINTWSPIDTVWAARRAAIGKRFFSGEQKHFEAISVFRIRHRTDVIPGYRLTLGSAVYEIIAADEEGRMHFLDLTCRAFDQNTGVGSGAPTAFTSANSYTIAAPGTLSVAAGAYGYNIVTVTFTGGAGNYPIILPTAAGLGAKLDISLIFPATLGLIALIGFPNSVATPIYSVESDGSGAKAYLQLFWNGTTWQPINSNYPA